MLLGCSSQLALAASEAAGTVSQWSCMGMGVVTGLSTSLQQEDGVAPSLPVPLVSGGMEQRHPVQCLA